MPKIPEERVRGKVNTYSESVKSGVVVCEKRQTYLFSRKEWLSELPPVEQLEVSFIVASNWAKSIMLIEEAEA